MSLYTLVDCAQRKPTVVSFHFFTFSAFICLFFFFRDNNACISLTTAHVTKTEVKDKKGKKKQQQQQRQQQ